MDPENPSRRKKTGAEPKTIDLEAVPASAGNEAVVEDSPVSEGAVEATSAEGEVPLESETTDYGTEAASDPDTTASSDSGPEATSESSYAPPPVTPTARTSNSGTIAAAILGGLIALAGAGALQYGGLLPALGPSTSDTTAIDQLSAEIEALKAQVAEAPAETGTVDLAPIESRLSSLEQTVAAGANAPDAQADLSEIEGRMGTLGEEIAALRAEMSKISSASNDAAAVLTERLAAAEKKIEEPRSDVTVARAVAASALKTAIDRGGPFLAELEAFASVSPDDPAVAGLREIATTGVRSRSDLVGDFSDAADAILDAIHQPGGDAGIVDRLLSSASSIVRVRPVGSVEGDSPEAIVARIENKLQNGDFKGAQIEWQALPEAGSNAAAEYKAALDRRVEVEDSIGTIVSGAMTPNQG